MLNVADIYFFLLFVALPFASFNGQLASSDPFLVSLRGLFRRQVPFARLTVKLVCFVGILTEILSLLLSSFLFDRQIFSHLLNNPLLTRFFLQRKKTLLHFLSITTESELGHRGMGATTRTTTSEQNLKKIFQISKTTRLSSLRLRSRQPLPTPSPPAEPCPWLWRCHHCRIIYRVATTRRCLECDHEFCLGAPNNTATSSRKRKRGGSCKSEFDYVGWAARGAWRRTLLLNADKPRRNGEEEEEEDLEGGMVVSKRCWISPKEMTTQWGDEHTARNKRKEGSKAAQEFEEKKDAMFLRRRHNCWVHCDFPSECRHAMYAAQQKGRPVLARATAVDEAYVVLGKVERMRAQESEGEDESDSGDSATTVSSPSPLLAGVDGEQGDLVKIKVITGEEEDEGHLDAVDRYQLDGDFQNEPAAAEYFDDEKSKTPRTISTTTTTMDLQGDYSYESLKRSLGPDPCSNINVGISPEEVAGVSLSTRRTMTTTTTTTTTTDLVLDSPPLSPFSLARAEACCDPGAAPLLMVDGQVLQDAAAAEGRNITGEEEKNNKDEYELDELLHALFKNNKGDASASTAAATIANPWKRRYSARRAQQHIVTAFPSFSFPTYSQQQQQRQEEESRDCHQQQYVLLQRFSPFEIYENADVTRLPLSSPSASYIPTVAAADDADELLGRAATATAATATATATATASTACAAADAQEEEMLLE